MAKSADVSKAIQKAEASVSIQHLIEQSKKELGKALPPHMGPERMVRIALTCIRLNPALGECTPASFLGALFTGAQLGLEPIAGRAYLIPFNNKRKIGNEWTTVKEVQFVVGYKGMVELFYRHAKAVQLDWGEVCEHDDFTYEKGTRGFLRHVPSRRDRGEVIGFWAMAELAGGGKPFLFMTYDECIEHGQRHSKTFDRKTGKFYPDSPWDRDETAMCLKTVLIQLAKLLPLSVELQRAIGADETSRDFRKDVESALDLPVNTTWSEEQPEVSQPEKKEPQGDDAFLKSIQGLRSQGVTDEAYDFLLKQYGADEVGDPLTVPSEKRTEFLIELGKKVPKK